jgi:hypothetical protein
MQFCSSGRLLTGSVTHYIVIKVLLVCDWLISVQLIPNSSAKICNHSAIFCNHYEPNKIELSFGGKKLKVFFLQNKHGRI